MGCGAGGSEGRQQEWRRALERRVQAVERQSWAVVRAWAEPGVREQVCPLPSPVPAQGNSEAKPAEISQAPTVPGGGRWGEKKGF